MHRRQIGQHQALVDFRHTDAGDAADDDIDRIQIAFGGGGQQGQRAADPGLHQVRQLIADDHFGLRRVADGRLAGDEVHLRTAQAKVDLRHHAAAYKHRRLVTIGDQAGKLRARRHGTHFGQGGEFRCQRGGVRQAMLQRHVFIAVEAASMRSHHMPRVARRHFFQRFVGE